MASILVSSIVVGLIGAGISAYGMVQSGKSQKAISQFNAQQQEKQAATQAQSMQIQAALQKQEAETNFRLRQAEAQAKFNNATSIENQALGKDAINRQNALKKEQEVDRLRGQQRAAIAASGAAESTGTPLDILAETASLIQQERENRQYGEEMERRTLFSEAAQQRLGGDLALAGATLDRDSKVAAAGLRDATGQSQYAAGMRQAEITRLTGSAARDASFYQAGGTIFSSHADGLATASKVDWSKFKSS